MNIQITKVTDSISSQGYIKTLEIRVIGNPREIDEYYEKITMPELLGLSEKLPFYQKVSNYVLRFINLWR